MSDENERKQMKHRKQTKTGGVVGLCFTAIYFFVGMFFYLILFFLRIGSSPNWIEIFFLIYGLVGMLFILPYLIGMFGRTVIPCDDECGCELDYYDEDDECVEEKFEKKEVTPKRNTSKKKTTTKRKENKK